MKRGRVAGSRGGNGPIKKKGKKGAKGLGY